MATAAAELFVRVSADTKGLTSGFDSATKAAQDMGGKVTTATESIGTGLDKAGSKAGIFGDVFKGAFVGALAADVAAKAIGFFTNQLTGAVSSLMEVEKANAQTASVIKSTGGAAGVSAQQVIDFANGLEKTTGIAAESIQRGQNLLLTFTNIKNGVGEGNQVFDQASKIMVDLASAMGGDAKGAAIQLGKALNDPTQGMTALTRVGVSFTDAQKEQVKALQASGDMMGAQKIILAELNKEFGGSAEAAGQTLPGALSRLDNGIQAVMKNMMGPAVPFLTNGLGVLADAAFKLADVLMDPGGVMDGFAKAFGPTTRALIIGIGTTITIAALPAIAAMLPALATVALAFVPVGVAAAKFALIAGAVAAAAYPIINNWDTIKGAMVSIVNRAAEAWSWFSGKVASIASGAYRFLTEAFAKAGAFIRSVIGDELADKVSSGFGKMQAGAVSFGAGVSEKFGQASDFVKKNWGGAVNDVRGIFNKLTSAASTDFSKMYKSVGDVGGALESMGGKADAAGKKAAKAAKENTKEMREAEKAATKLAKETEGLYKKYIAQELATQKLGEALAKVRQEAESKGRSFDVASATAKAYSDNISRLEQAFGKMSPQVISARAEMAKFADASANGGKVLADAYGVIDEASKSLDAAARKAALMGKEFDGAGEAVKSAEGVMSSLIDKGLRPGNLAFDEAAKRLAEVRKAAEEAKNPLDGLREATGGISQNLSSLASNMKTVTETLGVEGLGPILDATDKVSKFGTAIFGVVGNIEGLIKAATAVATFFSSTLVPALATIGKIIGTVVVGAVNSLTIAIAANPIGAIIIGVIALVAAGLWLYENWDYVVGELSKAWEWMKSGAISAFEAIGKAVTTIWDGIVGVIKGAVNAVIGLVNLLIRGLNRINVNVPSWVPGMGGQSFGINIPQVPYLATGGIVTSPTMAHLGEGGRPEAVLPLNENVYRQIGQGIASARGGGGGAQVVVQYYGNGKWTREDAQGLGRMLVSELRTMGVKA
jgi:phage-related protein